MVSFLVVAMPHIVPCPVPRMKLADEDWEDGRPRQRKKTPASVVTEDSDESVESDQLSSLEEQRVAMRRRIHECPVPKPGGPIGRLLGAKPGSSEVQRPSMVIQDRKSPKESNAK